MHMRPRRSRTRLPHICSRGRTCRHTCSESAVGERECGVRPRVCVPGVACVTHPTALFPVAWMALMSSGVLAVPSMTASLLEKVTLALLTPGTARSDFSTPPTQPPQVMPSTLRTTRCWQFAMAQPDSGAQRQRESVPQPQPPSLHTHPGPQGHDAEGAIRTHRLSRTLAVAD